MLGQSQLVAKHANEASSHFLLACVASSTVGVSALDSRFPNFSCPGEFNIYI